MSDFTIKVDKDQINSTNILIVENQDTYTVFRGHPTLLRKIVFWLGDVVWPGWYENEKGRETYLKYADDCSKGTVSLQDKGFLEVAWPQIKRHLDVDGVYIVEAKATV